MKRPLAIWVASVGMMVMSAYAAAQPLKLIVPTPAGGPSDTAARVVAQSLAKATGQVVLVENKVGANGAVAAHALIAAPADGRTLLWGIASMTGIPMLQTSAPFKSLTELAPVSLVGRFAFGMFVNSDVPATSVAEFVRYAKGNPDKLYCAYGTLGEMMAAAQFMQAAGIRVVFVPYKGGAQLMPDLVSGRVQVNFGPVSSGLQHVNAGKLRMLATVAPQRTMLAPGVPTLAEASIATASLPTWQAIFAPPRTPPEFLARMSREIAAVLHDPEVKARLEQQALQVEGSTPDALAHVVEQDVQAWRAFIRDNHIPQD